MLPIWLISHLYAFVFEWCPLVVIWRMPCLQSGNMLVCFRRPEDKRGVHVLFIHEPRCRPFWIPNIRYWV
jgi:hypothetical protein